MKLRHENPKSPLEIVLFGAKASLIEIMSQRPPMVVRERERDRQKEKEKSLFSRPSPRSQLDSETQSSKVLGSFKAPSCVCMCVCFFVIFWRNNEVKASEQAEKKAACWPGSCKRQGIVTRKKDMTTVACRRVSHCLPRAREVRGPHTHLPLCVL